ncbi:hypothetical protein SG09_35020 [Bradyrhizobium ottawaense]|nr:hypothetical protein SG09_35020 [Bradyrhizobium ottawaense]GMO51263.1 hypothetical protein BwSF21_73720 [Bradyrhizobium ottawaense]GMO77732.1 hypothetical protein BwSG20_52550 [Bradyrhizobium ottawaense]GMO90712.1 hypothetical protein BwSF19_65140 [Bradyrhizobium ottawaense]
MLSPETSSVLPPSLPRKSRTRLGRSDAAFAGLDRSNDGQDHTVLPYAGFPLCPRASSPKGLAGIERRSYNAACGTLKGFGSIHRPALRLTSATALPSVHRSPIRGS